MSEKSNLMKIITMKIVLIPKTLEFDPGSGRTLAARLTHASRTEIERELALEIS